MKIEGAERVPSTPDATFARLTDPEVLKRCVPGLVRLEPKGEDRFAAELEIRLAAISGQFSGEVQFVERVPPLLRARLDGKGGPGFVRGDVSLRLEPAEGGAATLVHYVADVQVGGQIARLGQRMISGIAKEMAGQFFTAFAQQTAAALAQPAAPPSAFRAALALFLRLVRRWLGLSPSR